MICKAAQDIVKQRETLQLVAYDDGVGVATWGYGHTKGVTMADVKRRATTTVAQAEAWFLEDIGIAERAVRSGLKGFTSENELGAMVSLAFNIGNAGFLASTVLRKHNAGDRAGAAEAFKMWVKGTDPKTGQKITLGGLVKRRQQELELYLCPDK